MRILVCGGRDYVDYIEFDNKMCETYSELCEGEDPDHVTIIHGGARGADAMAGVWAKSLGFSIDIYPADWDRYGKAAGFIRNQKMLDVGKPDFVVAFPGGRGTTMMIDLAKKAGIEVIKI